MQKRNMLRLTAKATQFGQRTFTSWLIESAGTVPINRRKDSADGNADNTEAMLKLVEALEMGDAVCLFPEGMSRYHPTIAPLKTGVARLVSDVLTRNCNRPDFEISVSTCSVTYMHRQHFRSDVLVTFHEPLVYRVKDNPEFIAPVNYNDIRLLTAKMQEIISSGTIDSPTWDLVRTAKTTARIYAPFGTLMSLGDHVRVIRNFIDALRPTEKHGSIDVTLSDEDGNVHENIDELKRLRNDLKVMKQVLCLPSD
ncbi:hypothetical protein C0992_005278 [Termitomyces sp. T32_za158]|nr:hypothetical protein C0992_005278 [Termitomyces sp. T32_za158]